MDNEQLAHDPLVQPITEEIDDPATSTVAALNNIPFRFNQYGLIWLVAGVTFANGLFNIAQMLALQRVSEE